jgi:hypothetical protein
MKGMLRHSQNSCKAVIFLALAFLSLPAAAQINDKDRLDENTQDKLENIASSTDGEVDFTTLLDKLAFYVNNPLDLNKATRKELQELTLLNELQVNALLEHIRVNGKLIALEELQTIDGFDAGTIRSLLPYVRVGSTQGISNLTLKRMLAEGKNVLFVRGTYVTEEAKGYTDPHPETNDTNRYLGSRLKLFTRYRYVFDNSISLGITAEKDAGEEFFQGTQPQGFDFYSAHFFYRGEGLVQKVVLGDFQAQYGQGLVLWSGLAYGKSADVLNIRKSPRGLLPYSSVDENVFMRGAGVSLAKNNFQADLFYSNKNIDGNLSNSVDTLEQEDIVTSFQENGDHRTYSELHDKHALGQTLYGGHLQYTASRWNVGLTAYATKYDMALVKDVSLYSKYDFQGDYNSNFGFDYGYNYRNLSFFGEAGRSNNGGMAFINGLLVSLDPRIAISIIYRNYQRDYQALLSNGFAENSKTANEQGTYFGLNARLTPVLTLNAYFDHFHFPWLRYQVDAPSGGHEYLLQLTYLPSKTFEAYVRVKHRSKDANNTDVDSYINTLTSVDQTNYRFNIHYKASSAVTLANRVELLDFNKGSLDHQRGFLAYQDVAYKVNNRLTCSFRYVIFDTDSYDSRIYTYESDVLYAFSIPSLYYRGSRYYIVMKYKIMKGVDVWLRYARTSYTNQQTIGSGLDEIDGNHKSEIKAQIRIEF